MGLEIYGLLLAGSRLMIVRAGLLEKGQWELPLEFLE